MTEDRPEYGKQYSLTGGIGKKSIANGNSWAESEVKKTDEKKHNEARHKALEKKKKGKDHKCNYKSGACTTCGKSAKENYNELEPEDRDINSY